MFHAFSLMHAFNVCLMHFKCCFYFDQVMKWVNFENKKGVFDNYYKGASAKRSVNNCRLFVVVVVAVVTKKFQSLQ